MAAAVRVLLPPPAHNLADLVLQSGCTPVLDATAVVPARVPDGAWVRIRAGQAAPGAGPVVLAEDGAPVLDRPTWLETAVSRAVPSGFAGLVLRGSEAAGAGGEASGLDLLAAHPDPGRVLVDAGAGPTATAAIAALGAAGVLVAGPLLALPELGLPPALRARLDLPDDEITHRVAGLRVGNSPTSPVLRALLDGADPWALARDLWRTGDPRGALWLLDQGAALAPWIAEVYGTLPAALAAYADAWGGWGERAGRATAAGPRRVVHTGAALQAEGTAAGPGGAVGIGALWDQAARLGRPIAGPLRAAVATGLPIVADAAAIADEVRATRERAAARGLAIGAADLRVAAPPPAPAPPAATSPSGRPHTPQQPAPGAEGPAAVAIVGIGCQMPGAADLATFWRNIKGGVSAIGEVPADRWSVARFYDPDPAAPDKTYAKIGGFIRDFTFDNRRFRVPPRVVSQIDPVQQITLHAVDEALRDAGLKADARDAEGRAFDRDRCAVILGNSLGGELKDDYALRLGWPVFAEHLRATLLADLTPADQQARLDALETRFKADLPVIDEDSMPGELSNVIAGRVANAFDLRGPNFTTDAACAGSMAAIQAAVNGLQRGDFDIAVTGGADRSMNVPTYVKFCKIGALSPDRSTPFDKGANGFVMGEGVGVLVLKRLDDALAAGDRVYAIIRGIGASSDGKGKGITAPNPRGQRLALERAYADAGVDPATVDLIEAHGTSTAVGDGVELSVLSEFVGAGRRGDRGPLRVGSVKSMIGHLKSAAGAAAVIKAAVAVHEGVLPPSLGFTEARPDVDLDRVPLRIQTRAEPWPATPDGVRRAGVSSFGFGGTNFHIVLESWAGQDLPRRRALHAEAPASERTPPAAASPAAREAAPIVPAPARAATIVAPAPSPSVIAMTERPLPEGLWATSALDRADLLRNLRAIAETGRAPWNPSDPLRIAAAAATVEERRAQIDRALKVVEKEQNPELLRARNIYYEDAPVDGKVAFLFTGQGSQYADMGLDLAAAFPLVQQTFDEADRILTPALGRPITDFIRLAPGEDPEEKELILRRTEYSQPATLTLDVAILRVLASYGVFPDMVAGHSLGEYGACVAAGIMDFEQALMAVSARGREMANIRLDDPGKMAGVAAPTEVVEEILADVSGYVIAANKNCPSQTVIAGASDAVDEAVERFGARGITVYRLPVSHAFHSSIVAPASEPLKGVLRRLGLQAPRRPITTNVTSDYYPSGPDAAERAIALLGSQISAPVEWTSQIDRMYADGARIFVECGPKRALTGFVVSILKRKPHRAYYTNHPKRGGDWSLRDALAGLLAAGVPVRARPSETIPDLFALPEPRKATTEAVTARLALASQQTEAMPDVTQGILKIVAAKSGYDVADLDLGFELEADLGIDTVKQAEIFAVVRETYGIPRDPSFRFEDHRTLRSVIDWAAARMGATRPTVPATATEAPPPGIASDAAVERFLVDAARAGLDGLDAERFASALLPSVQALLKTAFDAARASGGPDGARTTGGPNGARTSATPAAPPPPPATATAAPPTAPPSSAHPTPAAAPGPRRAAPPGPFPRVVCSGASVGLPGGNAVFSDDNLARVLAGENRITPLGERARAFLDLGLVRLVKDPTTGSGTFARVTDISEVIRLAGQAGAFDLRDWGFPESIARACDTTTQLAIAAALEALRDAGIPLRRTYKTSTSGKQVPQGWALPEPLADETGVIFASAFPGYDELVRHVEHGGDDGEGAFDRRFLFQILAMGHSQLAQAIGARGPNTQVNAACASPAQAIGIAQDWLRVGRCRRVIVVSADNVTSEPLLKWLGGGFLAAGAASTHDVVDETALPFDARRHGMILGMGAHGTVIETLDACRERGVTPIAELLHSTFVNSAFHGTRLHPTHISEVVAGLVAEACASEGITPEQMASSALFMSHETYTPARGGSAQAEIAALRAAFGGAADRIVITNTKGYTGHAMGAGIEDTVALKALQYGIMPPIANFRDPDPELGDLRLARGERLRVRYALRLAAGFGSQLAVTLWRAIAIDDDRDDPTTRAAWLRRVTGFAACREAIELRTLRVHPADRDELVPLRPAISPADVRDGRVALPGLTMPGSGAPSAATPTPTTTAATQTSGSAGATPAAPRVAAPTAEPASIAPSAPLDAGAILAELVALVADKTGYDPSEIDPSFELEADLGIDTVKQAEIFSEIRERHGLARDESFALADYPTVQALAGWLAGAIAAQGGGEPARGGASADAGAAPPPSVESPAPSGPDAARAPSGASAISPPTPASGSGKTSPADVTATRAASVDAGAILAELVALVADKTGYDPSEIDPSFELEADLGIDTVKQAEIFSEIRERHGLARDESFALADYPTVQALAGWLAGAIAAQSAAAPPSEATQVAAPSGAPAAGVSSGAAPSAPSGTTRGAAPAAHAPPAPSPIPAHPATAHAPVAPPRSAAPVDAEAILTELVALVADKTGYDPSEIDPSFELEADLGIDTVKQAEIFSEIRERHGLARDESFALADYPTVQALAGWLAGAIAAQGPVEPPPEPGGSRAPARAVAAEAPARPEGPAQAAGPGPTPPTPRGADPASGPLRLDPPPDVRRDPPTTAPLPEVFRLRRPVLVPAHLSIRGALRGERVEVLGAPELVVALEAEVQRRGATVGAPGTVVVDVSPSPIATFTAAKDRDAARPRRWVAVTTLGGLEPAGVTPDEAAVCGARAGFAKSLGREWEDTLAQVVDAPAGLAPEALAALIADELDAASTTVEIFRSGRQRRALAYATVPAPEVAALPAGAVALVTGGGRGITARVAEELARRAPITLVIVGRGPAASAVLDIEAEKHAIRNALKATGARVTPAEIERRLDPLRRADEIRANLDAMRVAGAVVEYERADLADLDAVRALVEGVIGRHGRLDLCIHGAGVEESRLLAVKDEAAFRRVYEGKADGGLALMRALPKTAMFVSMGSVAGRFGNAGQVDYSAANDAMARATAARGRALHIDWTAWDDVGMAVRGGMKRLLTDRGVDLLPADAGAGLLADLIAGGATGELVVAGRLGDFLPPPEHPLLDRSDLAGDDATATARIDLERCPWLADHAIAEVPVLPGVIGIELMAAVAAIAHPGQAYAGARDVRFAQPAKLHRGEPLDLEVRATPDTTGELRCELTSRRTLRTGREQHTAHFSGVLQLGVVPEIDGLPDALLPDERWSRADIYQRFFHGPRFQVMTDVLGVARDGLLAEGVVDPEALGEGLLTEPLVLEAAFQAAGLHHMIVHGEMALPSAIQAVQLLGTAQAGERLTLLVRRRGPLYDVDVTAPSGPLLRLRGFAMAVLGPLDHGQRFATPDWDRPTVFPGGAPEGRPSGALARATLHEDPAPWLRPDEIAALSARGTARRVADRIAGRIAAKRALAALTGAPALAISVPTAPSGEPIAIVPGYPTARVSVSHRGGRAVAIATLRGRVGVDVELVEPRPPAFVEDWFEPDELRALGGGDRAVTLGWACKEAIQKALGAGMAVSPRDIRVTALRDRAIQVALAGRAAALHRDLGGGALTVTWAQDGEGSVRVEATLAA